MELKHDCHHSHDIVNVHGYSVPYDDSGTCHKAGQYHPEDQIQVPSKTKLHSVLEANGA